MHTIPKRFVFMSIEREPQRRDVIGVGYHSVQHDSANATASAPAAMRTGHDGSFAARHTASATSSARVTADDLRRLRHSREDTLCKAGVRLGHATLHPGPRVLTEAGLWRASWYHQAHTKVQPEPGRLRSWRKRPPSPARRSSSDSAAPWASRRWNTCSPGAWRWQKNLLRRKEGGIAEVAKRVGYSSASTFSVAFTRHVGLPPARYAREQMEPQ
jgi:hypothetical protein